MVSTWNNNYIINQKHLLLLRCWYISFNSISFQYIDHLFVRTSWNLFVGHNKRFRVLYMRDFYWPFRRLLHYVNIQLFSIWFLCKTEKRKKTITNYTLLIFVKRFLIAKNHKLLYFLELYLLEIYSKIYRSSFQRCQLLAHLCWSIRGRRTWLELFYPLNHLENV